MSKPIAAKEAGRFVGAAGWRGAHFQIFVDGVAIDAKQGQNVLTAILEHGREVRRLEFNNEPRAGFCLMGACFDCWVWIDGRIGVRACREPVQDGMKISTRPAEIPLHE